MKTLLLGHLGSIGKRYASILDHFGYDWVGHDAGEDKPHPGWDGISHVIVAVPTNNHYQVASEAICMGKAVLCEKPLSKRPNECIILENLAKGKDAFVVCNYSYALRKFADQPYKITYANYRTGNDGLWWDVCQLLYLDPKAKIYNKTPYFMLEVNGKEVPYKEIEYSYIHMIQDFCEGRYSKLWNFEDGRKMTDVVLGRMQHESIDRSASTNMVDEVAQEDLLTHR